MQLRCPTLAPIRKSLRPASSWLSSIVLCVACPASSSWIVNWPIPICKTGSAPSALFAMTPCDTVCDGFDLDPLEAMLVDVNRRLKRGKAFDEGRVQGRLVAALDGIEVLSSFSRRCDSFLERRVTVKDLLRRWRHQFCRFHAQCTAICRQAR